jgi:subtilisin family serine protease
MEEQHMKRISCALLTGIALSSTSALAGNDFAGATSTASGYSTWDADLINVEAVSQTGRGVYVAVLDTGLVPNWRDYFPRARVAEALGTGFEQSVAFRTRNGDDPCGLAVEVGPLRQTTWVGSTGSTHGTHVTSTIVGYNYLSPNDAVAGFALPPIQVRGIAPDVTIIPVKVLADYQIPPAPLCPDPDLAAGGHAVFGTSGMLAAGLDYVTNLARAGYRPMVVNMSLGGDALEPVEKAALDRAIANGVIVVAAAGNEGETGMSYPGAYAPVISAGSAGWTGEWLFPGAGPRYRMWWLQYPNAPIVPNSGNTADPTVISEVYVSDFSSRALAARGHQLDVLAPGSWVRGPFPGDPGFNHLPWWSNGAGALRGRNSGNFFYVGGTSMATPHVASVAALMLQKNPALTQSQVEAILKSTALVIPAVGTQLVFDFDHFTNIGWDNDCGALGACDAVGAGLIRADAAIAATP